MHLSSRDTRECAKENAHEKCRDHTEATCETEIYTYPGRRCARKIVRGRFDEINVCDSRYLVEYNKYLVSESENLFNFHTNDE